tara:strand:- start:238 stop:417 length:180 start_codon:yes stop_codon:yes gene_type:complete
MNKITKSEIITEAIEYFYQCYSVNEGRIEFLRNPKLEGMGRDMEYCVELMIRYIMQDNK